MNIQKLVIVLLSHMALFPIEDLNLSSEYSFIHSPFIVFMDYCLDTIMTLGIQEWKRQYNSCPYGLSVEEKVIKQIIINAIMLQNGKWHTLGNTWVKSPTLALTNFSWSLHGWNSVWSLFWPKAWKGVQAYISTN